MAVKCRLRQLLNLKTKSRQVQWIGTFTIRNEHGLHARLSAVLVNEVKKFASKITSTKSYSRNRSG